MSPSSSLPSQILLDYKCRIGNEDHQNSTSARTQNSQGLSVEVCFNILDPPAISLCFARCDDLTGSRLAREPMILGAAGALVLLLIPFSGSAIHPPYNDYFVYRAGPRIPSLHLLSRPYPTSFRLKMVAILPICDDSEHYAVVLPVLEYFMLESRNHHTLHIYRSDRKVWCTKVARIAEDTKTQKAKEKLLLHDATSVVYAGTGFIGWVDLWWWILLCKVLDENPTIRFVPLPVPEPCQTPSEFHLEFQNLNPRPYRHLTIYNGLMKFIELKFYLDGCACSMKRVHDQGWVATTWSRPISSDVWLKGLTIDTSDMSITDSIVLHLLPAEILDEEKKLTWERLISGGPTLSLHDNDIVYIMMKVNFCDPTACVLAINTRNLRLESCAQCSIERMICPESTYVPSALSSYFGTTAGTPP